jgi:death-on-curing protein
MPPETISYDDVLKIHGALVEHFARENDPIDPPGIRSTALLESAVSRQDAGIGNVLKYSDPRENAATLMYGICMNHAFHNGNKRTALVAGLVHLEKNGYMPNGAGHDEFYDVMVRLADHKVAPEHRGKKRKKNALQRVSPDEEVEALGRWLRRHTRRVDRHEHPLTFRELRRILTRLGCSFGDPTDCDIVIARKIQFREKGLFGFGQKVREKELRSRIHYSNEGTIVGAKTVRKVRRELQLMPEDGTDSGIFYNAESTLDFILHDYRTVLRRLARV